MNVPPPALLANGKQRFTMFLDDTPKGQPRTYSWVDHRDGSRPIIGCTHPHECIARWETERASLYPELYESDAARQMVMSMEA